MATELTRQVISPTTLTPSFSACDLTGNMVINDGRTFLYFKGTSTALTITISKQKSVLRVEGYGDVSMSDITISMPASAAERLIELPSAVYNDGNGRVNISYTSITGLTVAAFRLQEA